MCCHQGHSVSHLVFSFPQSIFMSFSLFVLSSFVYNIWAPLHFPIILFHLFLWSIVIYFCSLHLPAFFPECFFLALFFQDRFALIGIRGLLCINRSPSFWEVQSWQLPISTLLHVSFLPFLYTGPFLCLFFCCCFFFFFGNFFSCSLIFLLFLQSWHVSIFIVNWQPSTET